MPSDPRPMTPYKCSIVTIALSRTETVIFSRWPWSDLSRSPEVKLIMPSDSRPMIPYYYFEILKLLKLETFETFETWNFWNLWNFRNFWNLELSKLSKLLKLLKLETFETFEIFETFKTFETFDAKTLNFTVKLCFTRNPIPLNQVWKQILKQSTMPSTMHVRNVEIPLLRIEKSFFRKYSETHITSYT